MFAKSLMAFVIAMVACVAASAGEPDIRPWKGLICETPEAIRDTLSAAEGGAASPQQAIEAANAKAGKLACAFVEVYGWRGAIVQRIEATSGETYEISELIVVAGVDDAGLLYVLDKPITFYAAFRSTDRAA